MTGDPLSVAVQAAVDARVAAAVAEVVERIATNLDRIAESTRESAVGTPPEYAAEVFGHRKRAEAFARSAEIVRSYAPVNADPQFETASPASDSRARTRQEPPSRGGGLRRV